MEKIVVVSSNNNPDYLFYLPYVEKAWAHFGWSLCVLVTNDVDTNALKNTLESTRIIKLPNITELRTETIAQVSRLYAANFLPDDALIMTSDMDLIPLSDYWSPSLEDVTVYGYDLTDRTTYPMSYIAMSGASWKSHLRCTGCITFDMLRDAREFERYAYNENWEMWWGYDQHLVTKRLGKLKDLGTLTLIDRGRIQIAGANLAIGRVDRYNWIETQKQSSFIDAHCHNNNVEHEDKLIPFLELYNKFHEL
jgi:hypothetical protein